jgi:acyl carrier protein
MTDEQVIETIDNALCEEFELEPSDMTPEATLFDKLGLDSLDVVDMVIVLESTFSFKIREDPALREIRTLGDIHKFVIDKKRQIETEG